MASRRIGNSSLVYDAQWPTFLAFTENEILQLLKQFSIVFCVYFEKFTFIVTYPVQCVRFGCGFIIVVHVYTSVEQLLDQRDYIFQV